MDQKAIQTVPGVYRLAATPLLLRILAQLHRTGVPLPRQRVALYDQVTKTLTQAWRPSQGVPASALSEISPLFVQPHITRLLSWLAYWLHLEKPGGFAEDPWIRSAALWTVSQTLGPEVTGILLDVLSNDADSSVKQAAVKYLGDSGEASPQVTKALLDVLHEAAAPGGFPLRDAVVKSLGHLGDASPEVVSALIALLPRDILLSSHESVLQSLRQLSQLSSEVVPLVVNALQDATPRVRVAVAETLETFGHIAPDVLEELRNVPPQHSPARTFQVPFCVKQWYWLPDEIEVLLLYQLHNPQVRWEAIKALGQLEELSDRAEDALLVTLRDSDAHVRVRVIETLNAFEMSSEVLSTFINVLSSDTDA